MMNEEDGSANDAKNDNVEVGQVSTRSVPSAVADGDANNKAGTDSSSQSPGRQPTDAGNPPPVAATSDNHVEGGFDSASGPRTKNNGAAKSSTSYSSQNERAAIAAFEKSISSNKQVRRL